MRKPRTYEQIKEQVGPVTGTPPGAWWVGTDKTLPMRDAYHEKLNRQREAFKTIARELDCDPEKMWVNHSWGGDLLFTGFSPNDLLNPHPALRKNNDQPRQNIFIPNRRTKIGKELAARMKDLNNGPGTPGKHTDFTGYKGRAMRPMGDGRSMHSEVSLVTLPGHYPFLTFAENPDDSPFVENFEVDPELWERVPASWLMRIIEESKENPNA